MGMGMIVTNFCMSGIDMVWGKSLFVELRFCVMVLSVAKLRFASGVTIGSWVLPLTLDLDSEVEPQPFA